MNEKAEIKNLQKQIADRSSKTAAKVGKLLEKGQDLTASDIKWLLGKEVSRQRIAKAMKMSISTFERYLTEHSLTTKKRSKPADMNEVKKLLETTNLSRKEIAAKTGASYSAVSYHYRKKEREDVTEKVDTAQHTKIKEHYDRQIKSLEEKLAQYEETINNQVDARLDLSGKLREEQSKVKERDKMIQKLDSQVQELLKERTTEVYGNGGIEKLKKKHDLLLEYIATGGNA